MAEPRKTRGRDPRKTEDKVAETVDQEQSETTSNYVVEGIASLDVNSLAVPNTSYTIAASIKPYIPVGIHKVKPQAPVPEYATDGSMCFDLSACFDDGDMINGYTNNNVKTQFKSVRMRTGDNGETAPGISIPPHQRALVPTGLIFDLPEGTALLLYPRSGMSLKQGAKLGNCVGVVDNDYVEQTFAIIQNDADVPLNIISGDKICQGEVVFTPPQARFTITEERPGQKTTRAGGFGSTGK